MNKTRECNVIGQRATPMKIESLEDILAFLRETENRFGRHVGVFRGQANADWDLVPGIFREGVENAEYTYVQEFLHAAPSRYSKCPPLEDKASWLALMQHFGLPTRLLDWTWSVFNATFFAVWSSEAQSREATSGAVWALDMMGVNERTTGKRTMCGLHELAAANPEFAQFHLLNDAFCATKQYTKPLYAVVPAPQVDLRMQVQQGVFTIHNTQVPLNKQSESEEFCLKFLVPLESKESLRDELDALGINAANLFPDLQHLASDIRRGPIVK